MQKLLLGALSSILIFGLLCSCPVAVFAGPQPGASPDSAPALDSTQKRFADALRFLDREREYAAEKARYQQAVAERCAGLKWYDLGLLECALFVPLFGLILPFFGIVLFGTVRSRLRTSSNRAYR